MGKPMERALDLSPLRQILSVRIEGHGQFQHTGYIFLPADFFTCRGPPLFQRSGRELGDRQHRTPGHAILKTPVDKHTRRCAGR